MIRMSPDRPVTPVDQKTLKDAPLCTPVACTHMGYLYVGIKTVNTLAGVERNAYVIFGEGSRCMHTSSPDNFLLVNHPIHLEITLP